MCDRPKRGRCWFQFSLRGLLVLMAVLAVLLGGAVNRAHQQRKAVAMIRQWGGLVYYDHQLINGRAKYPPPAEQPPGPKWLRSLVGDDFFRRVVVVDLSGTQVSDNDLEILGDLPSVRVLFLVGTQLTDKSLEHVRRMPRLEALNLTNRQPDDRKNLRMTTAGIRTLQQTRPHLEIIR
jgi:hypothetical protein